MDLADSALTPFLDKNGKPLASFAALSDDQARLCLAQLIDGLERLDELYGGFEAIGWRSGRSQKDDFAHWASQIVPETPMPPPPSEGNPWDFYCVMVDGKTSHMQDMTRQQVDDSIRLSLTCIERHQQVAILMATSAQQILRGVHLRDEGGKPDPEDQPKPKPRSTRP